MHVTDNHKIITTILCFYSCHKLRKKKKVRRCSRIKRQHLNCSSHFHSLLMEGQFRWYYRMSSASFERLVRVIGRVMKSRHTRTSPRIIVNKIQMTIIWIAGGSYQSIRAHAGYSVSGFYSGIHEVIDTINEVEVWKIGLPQQSRSPIENGWWF